MNIFIGCARFVSLTKRKENKEAKKGSGDRLAATALAQSGERIRIGLHSSSIRTNRAIVLKSSCFRSTSCFHPNRATLGIVIPDFKDSKGSVEGYFPVVPFIRV